MSLLRRLALFPVQWAKMAQQYRTQSRQGQRRNRQKLPHAAQIPSNAVDDAVNGATAGVVFVLICAIVLWILA